MRNQIGNFLRSRKRRFQRTQEMLDAQRPESMVLSNTESDHYPVSYSEFLTTLVVRYHRVGVDLRTMLRVTLESGLRIFEGCDEDA